MSATVLPHGVTGTDDAGAFLVRLTRLEPTAPVRLRSIPEAQPSRTALWGRLPWGVLVTRAVAGDGPGDATVAAADLLTQLARGGRSLPPRRDHDWRWPLPPAAGRLVERVPGAELSRLAAAAAATLRSATEQGVDGRRVPERALRDALLDHVAFVVTADGEDGPTAITERIEISQRLVQAVTKMGFLGQEVPSKDMEATPVQVRLAGRWVGLAAPYGVAWLPPVSQLALRPGASHPNR